MKRKNELLTLAALSFLVLLLCIPGGAFAGGGQNPGTEVPIGYKLIGPNTQGTLIVGWKPEGETLGSVAGFIRIGERLYAGLLRSECPEEVFNNPPLPPNGEIADAQAYNITTWFLPHQVVTDFNMDALCHATIFDYKRDVMNLQMLTYEDPLPVFKHILQADVKVSFLCPTK